MVSLFPLPPEKTASEPAPPVDTNDESSQSSPEASAEDAPEDESDTPQPEPEPPQNLEDSPAEDTGADAGSATSEPPSEAIPLEEAAAESEPVPELEVTPDTTEEPVNEPSTDPEPASDDKPDAEAASAADEPCPLSASFESAGSEESTTLQTCNEGNVEVLHMLHSLHFPFYRNPEREDADFLC